MEQSAVLFSGGLDSLSGAVETLASTDASLVLVSHQSQPGTKQVQRELAQALNARFPGRATLYGFECTLTGVRAAEETQRSRSFLYCAIGFALARASHSHVHAFGLEWDDTGGKNNGQYAPFAWRSA